MGTVERSGPRGPGAAARATRRAGAAGFTLMELMVVVVLVAILAILAIPAMRRSRDDKVAFDHARLTQLLIHRARTRAAGRGGAHLVAMDAGAARGRILLFEALDATAPPTGPNPASSCKTLNQWQQVPAWLPGVVGNQARIVDYLDFNTGGVNDDADIRAEFRLNDVTTGAAVMCITPGGTTFVGVGADIASAITDMQSQLPFNGALEARLSRHTGGTPIGITRRVIAAGMASPRIKSE